MDSDLIPTEINGAYERPYVTLVWGYKNRLEQIRKLVVNLPDRIGDRDYKIYLHDHGQGEECNSDCDVIEKVKDGSAN